MLTGRIQHDKPNVQVSLVMLKPDNFERRSRRPGNIIDAYSWTGLRIVGARLFNMTVAQGEDFYGPLKEIFVRKLKGNVTKEIYEKLRTAFAVSPETTRPIAARPRRISTGVRPAKLNRSPPDSGRETVK